MLSVTEMDNALILSKDGPFLVKHGKKYAISVILPYCGLPVFMDGMTFGQFFTLLEKEKELAETIFFTELGGHSLDEFCSEIKKPVPENKLEMVSRFTKNVIGWHVEYWDDKNGELPKLSIEPDVSIAGVKNSSEVPERYAADFTPLNCFRDLELAVDENIKFRSLKDYKTPILEGTLSFTLYHLLRAILDEITFYGLPSDRDDKKRELDKHIAKLPDGFFDSPK